MWLPCVAPLRLHQYSQDFSRRWGRSPSAKLPGMQLPHYISKIDATLLRLLRRIYSLLFTQHWGRSPGTNLPGMRLLCSCSVAVAPAQLLHLPSVGVEVLEPNFLGRCCPPMWFLGCGCPILLAPLWLPRYGSLVIVSPSCGPGPNFLECICPIVVAPLR